jgi:hypothetical protein
MVDRITRFRAKSGGFVSVEEMAPHCDLPPSTVGETSKYALFLRCRGTVGLAVPSFPYWHDRPGERRS